MEDEEVAESWEEAADSGVRAAAEGREDGAGRGGGGAAALGEALGRARWGGGPGELARPLKGTAASLGVGGPSAAPAPPARRCFLPRCWDCRREPQGPCPFVRPRFLLGL